MTYIGPTSDSDDYEEEYEMVEGEVDSEPASTFSSFSFNSKGDFNEGLEKSDALDDKDKGNKKLKKSGSNSVEKGSSNNSSHGGASSSSSTSKGSYKVLKNEMDKNTSLDEKRGKPPSFDQSLPILPTLNFEKDTSSQGTSDSSPKSQSNESNDDSFEDVEDLEVTVFQDKGLTNELGENNCFLNGLLQVLMHNNSFRRLIMSTDHIHSSNSLCVLCKIKDIFIDYKFGESDKIPGTALRKTLALIYQPQSKFQLRDMADASDCLEAILNRLHVDMSNSTTAKCNPTCLAHKIFSSEAIEKFSCVCGHSKSSTNSSFVQYYVVEEILDTAKATFPLPRDWERRYTQDGQAYYANKREKATQWLPPSGYGIENLNEDPNYSFSSLLRGVSLQQLISCEKDTCHFKSSLIRKLVKAPQTLSIGLNWVCEDPEKYKVSDTWSLVQPYILVSQLFEEVSEELKSDMMNLKGVVCFYGRHYIALSFSHNKNKWLMFDDSSVREVGETYDEVSKLCKKNRYQPCLLFYEKA